MQYAYTDLFNYYCVFSISKVIPDSFIAVSVIMDAVLSSQKDYGL